MSTIPQFRWLTGTNTKQYKSIWLAYYSITCICVWTMKQMITITEMSARKNKTKREIGPIFDGRTRKRKAPEGLLDWVDLP